MKNVAISLEKLSRTVRWGAAALTAVSLIALASLLRIELHDLTDWVLAILLVTSLSGLVYLLTGNWLRATVSRDDLQHRLSVSEQKAGELQDRLAVLQKLNRFFVNAQDERSLMQDVLALIGGLVGAKALSYIPLDEWGQPLASVLEGEIAPPAMDEWIAHLSSTSVSQVCRRCQVHKAHLHSQCPLSGFSFAGVEGVYCLPVPRGERVLGYVNLYLPPPLTLPDDLIAFLENLLTEMALGIDTLRLRNQELVTLRQLQLFRDPRLDLSNLLTELSDNVKKTLEVDQTWMIVRVPGRIPAQIALGAGLDDPSGMDRIQRLMERVIQTGEVFSLVEERPVSLPEGLGSMLVVPVNLSKEKSFGALAIGRVQPVIFQSQQIRLLETIADQAALLIENERWMGEVEYKAVIGERHRLAREIHDGMAQSLAFLKLQIGQLQNSLNRGDPERSRELVRRIHEALTESYLDVRQAIDNLRINPQAGVEEWLEQAIADFRTATNLEINLSRVDGIPAFPVEIQLQLIRVVQEALSNVRKHARAKHVDITLRDWQGDWILEIVDDGRGFSPDEVPNISQHGLRGMRERAEMIGADFQIISQPDQGTVVRLHLPKPLEETTE